MRSCSDIDIDPTLSFTRMVYITTTVQLIIATSA